MRDADAYPQYQLSHDPTCTACHLTPAGGGLLTENGLMVAENESWKGTDPTFFYGAPLPSWLRMSGDIRGAAGAVDNGVFNGAAYPMQAEAYASAGARGFSLNLTGGFRRPQDGGSPAHVVWSREHFLMWQQHPEDPYGLYVRVGRLMPVFGLRLAEHVVYTQRFGGYPLYGEAYAAAVAYVSARFEAHLTGFIHDPIGSPVEHGDGGAGYVEVRLGKDKHAQVGAEGKYAAADDLHRTYVGLTGKVYFPSVDLLVQAEAQLVHQEIVSTSYTYNQLIGYVLASRPIVHGWLLDVGVGHFTQNTDVDGNYRDCIDANVHWFVTSHLELLATTRLELLGSGPNGGYALAQLHYRL
ncbi:MAG TPA: hypothetical protein VFV99_14520 [Kofleriaceae bacterium]|nr:hypothetical protein [Kofleriaceae bacterium]